MNSSSNSGNLFSVKFPDSDLAKRFHCGRIQASYVAHCGLAPYFHELILSKLSDCPYISLSFDESSNSSVEEVKWISSFHSGARIQTVLPHAT